MDFASIKPYWIFIAGLALLYIFAMIMTPRGYRPSHHGRRGHPQGILSGETRHMLYEKFEDSQPTFYMFGTDWCPHCQTAKPEFTALGATKTIGGKVVKMVYVNPEKEPAAAEGFEVKGYPTFYLETAAGNKVKYNGARKTSGFLDFLTQQLA
jgi:thiol-disulfide isomerase/thioredoxin